MTQPNDKLSFQKGNAKLGEGIYTFSLPAGHTCPGAFRCLAWADRETGRISDSAHQHFRCFAASMEARYPSVRKSRWRNFELLRECEGLAEMITLIDRSLPAEARLIRVHVSGDFFSRTYFRAWMAVAVKHPNRRFYAYTKSIPMWVDLKDQVPRNFILTASEGGRHDALIGDLKRAKVVFSEEQAVMLGIEIDHDDSHAYEGTESFGLLLHGSQRAGTEAARALSLLRKQGKTGYGKATKKAVAA